MTASYIRRIPVFLRMTGFGAAEVTSRNKQIDERAFIIRNQPVVLEIGLFKDANSASILTAAELTEMGFHAWTLNISKNHSLSYPVYIQPDYDDIENPPISIAETGIISVRLDITDTEEAANAISGLQADLWEAELSGFTEEDTALEKPIAILQWNLGYINRVADENADAPGLLESQYYTKAQIMEILHSMGYDGGAEWGNIVGNLEDQTDLQTALDGKADLDESGKVPSEQLPDIPENLSDLHDDAEHRLVTDAEKETWNTQSAGFSGDYNDLTNKPTIPENLSDLQDDSSHRTVSDSEKTTWNSKSDFSGSYNDLSNKPSIPSTAADVGAIPTTEKGANGGVAELDNNGKVPATQSRVSDVQINGTTMLSNGVANIPIGDGSTQGVVRTNTAYGTTKNNGDLATEKASNDDIAARTNQFKPVVPSNLNAAVTAALTDANHITLNTSQQGTAQSVFNVPDVGNTGASLGLSIDSDTYVMTLTLKNAAGDTLDTKTVDLPLETMVVSASYANGTLTLTLQSGDTVDVDVSSIVSGLIPSTEKGANNGVATLGNDGKVPSSQLPSIPTALSDLTADSTHRTVTDEEKAEWSGKSDFSGSYTDLTDKPTIPSSASDVGAIPSTDKGANGGVASLGSDGKVPSSQLPAIPSALSDLTDDSTHRVVTDTEKSTWDGKSDFSGSYTDLTDKPSIPSALSDLSDDTTHRTVSDSEKTTWNGKSDFSGSYTDLTNKPTIPAALADLSDDATHRTVSDTEKASWNAKSTFSGSYNDLSNKPTIPATAADVSAIPASDKGANNGVATLGNDGKLPASQMPAVSVPVSATNQQIDAKSSTSDMVTPGNLDYAVRSVMPNIIEIPAATDDYSLLDAAASTGHAAVYRHAPTAATTYRLPAVSDNTVLHEITLYVTVTSSFSGVDCLDSAGNGIINLPLYPEDLVPQEGDVFLFVFRYEPAYSQWVSVPLYFGD